MNSDFGSMHGGQYGGYCVGHYDDRAQSVPSEIHEIMNRVRAHLDYHFRDWAPWHVDLGGSRRNGVAIADSDWDFSVIPSYGYYDIDPSQFMVSLSSIQGAQYVPSKNAPLARFQAAHYSIDVSFSFEGVTPANLSEEQRITIKAIKERVKIVSGFEITDFVKKNSISWRKSWRW